MSEYDLYAEVKCTQCGQMRQKAASFCPHCGHVVEESWWERFFGLFRSVETASPQQRGRGTTLSGLLTLGFAAYLLYNAVEKESLQSLIIAVMMLVLALRSFFSRRHQTEQTRSEEEESVAESNEPPDSSPVAPADKFFCENCGSEVAPDAVVCPKCGMRFA